MVRKDSSYLRLMGSKVAPPSWLSTDWRLGQFAKTQPVAQLFYAEFVAQGRNLPSLWPELKCQVLLGSEAFVAKMRLLLEDKGEHSRKSPAPSAGRIGRD